MKYTIYLVMICMGYSCSPLLTIQLQTAHAPLPDSSNYVLLRRTDSAVTGGEEIGNLSYERTGSSTPWSHDRIAGWMRATAMENGANLVKVTEYEHYRKYGLAHVGAKLYRVTDLRPYEREIVWTGERKLTYADFKGFDTPDTQSRSVCQFYTKTLFFCTESWINRRSADSAALLVHEQGNFDLCEIYRRQLSADLKNQRQYSKKAGEIFNQVYGTYLEKKRQYESETDRGLDDQRQAIWTKRISHALTKNGDDPDLFFTVEKVFTRLQKDSVAKQLRPLPDSALVYIIRPHNIGTPPAMRIVYNPLYLCCIYLIALNLNKYTVNYDDTAATEPIGGRSYIYLSLAPGEHSLGAGMNVENEQEGMFSSFKTKYGKDLDVLLRAGRTYYLTLTTNTTWFAFAAPRLEMVGEEKGRKLLNKCELSAKFCERNFQLFAAEDRFN